MKNELIFDILVIISIEAAANSIEAINATTAEGRMEYRHSKAAIFHTSADDKPISRKRMNDDLLFPR